MRILGLCGSLRAGSYNRQLLEAAGAVLPEGVRLTVFNTMAAVPPYNEDEDTAEPPASVQQLRDAIAQANAVLIATPEYNASIPGQLKNALDWASRPFRSCSLRDKPVAVIGASVSLFGAVWAQAELRKVLKTVGAHVIDMELPVAQAHEAFTPDGELSQPDLEYRLQEVLASLLAATAAGLVEQRA